MNIYQINKEYEDILIDLYDEDGVINEKALQKLEENNAAMENKAIAIASYIKNLSAEREAIKLAKQEMDKREKRNKKREEELMNYLLTNMQRREINKITCAHFDIKVKKCPYSVNIIDENILPDEYKRTKVEVLPDKIKMLTDLKNGVLISGATLQQNVTLEIK